MGNKADRAYELIEIAKICLAGGAPATAAQRLRTAADLLEDVAVAREAKLVKSVATL